MTFLSCSAPETPNLDSWVKKYSYEEDPVTAGEDFLMVMRWDLTISKNSENKYVGDLTVNGQQTSMAVAGNIVGNEEEIAFIYSAPAEDSSSTYFPGDTLFMLNKSNNTITTKWHKLKPMLHENFPATCNCFQ